MFSRSSAAVRCSSRVAGATLVIPRSVALASAAALAVQSLAVSAARATDVSPPVILQDFESTWASVTNKMPDVFAAGYGGIYTPPPSRAESGNQSVGYDVYDRFDLGSAGNPTLYGTKAGLQQMIDAVHVMGGSSYIDLVWNHDGFADTGTAGFAAAGGYPGFALTLQTTNPNAPGYDGVPQPDSHGVTPPYNPADVRNYSAVDGDFHSAYATGDQQERLAGLIDIAQESNYSFIRQPTVYSAANIPGPTPGAIGWNGHALANVPSAANAQFYPSTSGTPQTFTDPDLGGQSFTRYNFNSAAPMSGTPVSENATGYLERYAQYMVQAMGADGFRVDAAKNMPNFVLNYLDLATYQASNRVLLNGSREQVFNWSEVYDSNFNTLQSYVNKDINSASPSQVGGNRDVYDFPLFFSMQSNLTGNTANNNWYNVVGASFDTADDGKMNGSQGVKFVSSQDNGAPSLDSVAYAYTLMLPGNALVYYNGHNFGTEAQRSFPQDGREDALGGVYGSALTNLVDLRNRFGRGNYRQDWLETNQYAFERSGSALVMLSNNTQAGFDSRTIDVTFAPGTPLMEMTGNAGSSTADPHGDIPKLIFVNADSSSPTGASVNVRFLRNSTFNLQNQSIYTGDGYVIYGLPTPTGALNLTNVAGTFGGSAAKTTDSNVAYENGTQLNSSVDIIKSTTTQLQLNTNIANLLGYYRDHNADGDNAILKIDAGVDVNGTGQLLTDPTDPVTYGFEQFVTVHQPGYQSNNGAGGNGSYAQNIDVSKLGQGYHYIDVEAFRHRSDGGPEVYTDWKQTIYVDLAPPNSAPTSFNASVSGTNENRNLDVSSIDGLAQNIHTFLDLPYGLTDAQVLAMVGAGSQANNLDVSQWQHYYTGVSSGNHTATVVSYKPDGTYNIQRFNSATDSFLTVSSSIGSGIGDTNFDGNVNSSDISAFSTVLQSNNTQFNPAADVNGDGVIDLADTFLLGPLLSAHNVDIATFTAFNNLIASNYVTTGTYTVNGANNIYEDTAGATHVTAGASLIASYVRGKALNIDGSGVTIIRHNGAANGISDVSSIAIAGSAGAYTGQLDLTNNAMHVLYGSSADPDQMIHSLIASGYNGGQWGGMGITSTSATASNKFSLGYADGADHVVTGLAAGDLLINFVHTGDANLDSVVNVGDLTLLASHFGQSSANWDQGDFDYSGNVNLTDLALLESDYGAGTNWPASQIPAQLQADLAIVENEYPAFAAALGVVPEPSSAAVIGILTVGLIRRRRRTHTSCPPTQGRQS